VIKITKLSLRYWDGDEIIDWYHPMVDDDQKQKIQAILNTHGKSGRPTGALVKGIVKVIIDEVWWISAETFFNEIKPKIENELKIRLPTRKEPTFSSS